MKLRTSIVLFLLGQVLVVVFIARATNSMIEVHNRFIAAVEKGCK